MLDETKEKTTGLKAPEDERRWKVENAIYQSVIAIQNECAKAASDGKENVAGFVCIDDDVEQLLACKKKDVYLYTDAILFKNFKRDEEQKIIDGVREGAKKLGLCDYEINSYRPDWCIGAYVDFCIEVNATIGQEFSWQGLTIVPKPQKPEVEQVEESTRAKTSDFTTYSLASGQDLQYVVLQVTLKEKLLGTGSGNLTELEEAINEQAQKGYRLHTFSTSTSHSKGLAGGDRIQATMVFEKI